MSWSRGQKTQCLEGKELAQPWQDVAGALGVVVGNDLMIVLRAWYRFVASAHWLEVRHSAPLVIQSPKTGFMMDAYYDPGLLTDSDYQPTVVFRGYLFDLPPPEVYGVLAGASDQPDARLKATYDGLGTLPDAYGNYLRSKAGQLSRLSTDTYDLLRWRHKTLDGPTTLTIEPTGLFWADLPEATHAIAVDSLIWRQVPSGIRLLGLPPGGLLDLRPEAGHRVAEVLEERNQPPLGQVLFREAWRIRESNLRGALVMAVAAAESGAKEFISTVAPDTSWLLENLPSPPLDKILKNYLPTLPSKADAFATVPPLPKKWHNALKRAIETRNRVVHGHSVDLNLTEVNAALTTTLELLYFLDYHAGNRWAGEDQSHDDKPGSLVQGSTE